MPRFEILWNWVLILNLKPDTQFLMPSQIESPRLDLPLRDPLLLLVSGLLGAKVSTIIFCEVSFRFVQSMDLNILRALLISFDLLHDAMNVGCIGEFASVGLFPITRNFPFLFSLARSAQHLSSRLRENFGLRRAFISARVPFHARNTCAFFPTSFRGSTLRIRTFTTKSARQKWSRMFSAVTC